MNERIQRRDLSAADVLRRYKEEELPAFLDIALTDVNQVGLFGEHPLEIAACRGSIEELKALLEGGASIDATGEHGNTALHEAVAQGHVAAVKLLLQWGAKRDLQNEFAQTALDIARAREREDIASLLS